MHIEEIKSYFLDKDNSINIYDDKLYINNFEKINELSDTKIKITFKNKKINVIGEKFITKKILKKEILISGTINKIEFTYE